MAAILNRLGQLGVVRFLFTNRVYLQLFACFCNPFLQGLAVGGAVVNSALFNVDGGHRAVIFDRWANKSKC